MLSIHFFSSYTANQERNDVSLSSYPGVANNFLRNVPISVRACMFMYVSMYVFSYCEDLKSYYVPNFLMTSLPVGE